MRPRQPKFASPWLIGCGLAVSVACFALAVWLGLAASSNTTRIATRELAAQTDALARAIEADLTLFDLALREAWDDVFEG